MIGRFARSLGWKPHAPIAAGTILLVLGVWQGAEPLFAGYPREAALVPVTGSASQTAEVSVRSGGIPLFSGGPIMEFRAILEPGSEPVFYRSDLPAYDEVKLALEGDITVQMWPDAGDAADRTLIWGAAAGDVTIVPAGDVIARLRELRNERVTFSAILAIAGLAFVGFGVLRWRQTDSRIQR
ncbi:MAG: hypothetical protein AAF563_01355 [Pseudomonadota bacterium]